MKCSARRNFVESEYRGNEELNSKLTDSESEMSSKENLLTNTKSFPNWCKSGVQTSTGSSGETLLTDTKPTTYRLRKMRGKDEGYLKWQKTLDLHPKRKNGVPKKDESHLQK